MVSGPRVWRLVGCVALLELYKPDVVHLTLPWPVAAGDLRAACALTGVPTVVVHQLVPPADELVIAHLWFYSWTRSRRQRWVAVSDYGRRVIAESFAVHDPEAIPVIYNAAGRHYGDAAPASDEDRQRFGLEANDQVVVSVGRLSHVKGHDLLVAAAAELVPRLPRLRVLIAGSGEERAKLERAISAQRLDAHVRLIGQTDSVSALLRAADAFVFPSRMEGMPFALLEAMSLGLPVIATRFGGADEIIEPGENGLLVAMNDPGRLAAAIEETLGDPTRARTMAERGRLTVTRFSEDAMLTQTTQLLEAAARRR